MISAMGVDVVFLSTGNDDMSDQQPLLGPSILPDRFNLTSSPVSGGIVDVGPETSMPQNFATKVVIPVKDNNQ